MKFFIITRSLPPHRCGLGDHSLCLAETLRAGGHQVVLCAGRGDPGTHLQIAGDDWSGTALQRVDSVLRGEEPDHVILQFTPLAFSHGAWRVDRAVLRAWRRWCTQWRTTLIVHESYFRSLKVPRTLFRGSWQKFVVKEMSRAAHLVVSAWQPFIEEASGWSLERPPLLLPIGSNIPVARSDRQATRLRHGIAESDLVLTLFGGGNSLKWLRRHVDLLDQRLNAEGVAHAWLLLGGVKPDWFHLSAPIVDPGWLELQEISSYLQVTDLFLVPHWGGLCAKRGTLMAAMQHGLPVVGARGYMTDAFWEDITGATLINTGDAAGFCETVMSLSRSPETRAAMGLTLRRYHEHHLSWRRIADILVQALGPDHVS